MKTRAKTTGNKRKVSSRKHENEALPFHKKTRTRRLNSNITSSSRNVRASPSALVGREDDSSHTSSKATDKSLLTKPLVDKEEEHIPSNTDSSSNDNESDENKSCTSSSDDLPGRRSASKLIKRTSKNEALPLRKKTRTRQLNVTHCSSSSQNVRASSSALVDSEDDSSHTSSRTRDKGFLLKPSVDKEEEHIPSNTDSSSNDNESEENKSCSSSSDDLPGRRSASKLIKRTSKGNVDLSVSTEDNDEGLSYDDASQDTSSDGDTYNSQSDDLVDSKNCDEMSGIFSKDESDEGEVSPSRKRCCSSRDDAITDEPLRQMHVCWITPDGENRQCYNLETLRKVSIAREKDVLLQPPHFRGEISVELQDQIVSKFGSSGLLVHCSSTVSHKENYDSDEDYDFEERLSHYMNQLMGSRDIYVCPVCYCYKYNMMTGEVNNSDESACNIITSRSFKYDPMAILTSVVEDDGNSGADDEIHLASTFCFRLLKELKHHLTSIHNVDLSEITGNDLFKGYQIRASDGLLQRWLKTKYPRTIDVLDMRRYWTDENNRLDFIELGYRIDHEQSLRGTDHQFFESFSNQNEALWEMISGAFARVDEDELDDFIVEEGNETESVESGPRNIDPFNKEEESDPEVEFVKNLRAKRGADSPTSNIYRKTSSDEGSATEDNDDDDDISKDLVEESEEEDEWLSQKLVTPKKVGKLSKLRKRITASREQDDDSDLDITDTFTSDKASDKQTAPPQNVFLSSKHFRSSKKKRVIIDEFNDSE